MANSYNKEGEHLYKLLFYLIVSDPFETQNRVKYLTTAEKEYFHNQLQQLLSCRGPSCRRFSHSNPNGEKYSWYAKVIRLKRYRYMYKITICLISGSGEEVTNRRFEDDHMLRGENVGYERLVFHHSLPDQLHWNHYYFWTCLGDGDGAAMVVVMHELESYIGGATWLYSSHLHFSLEITKADGSAWTFRSFKEACVVWKSTIVEEYLVWNTDFIINLWLFIDL